MLFHVYERIGFVKIKKIIVQLHLNILVEDKLHWTFKLYDQDGSGEIDPDEMELIFTKFCTICQNTEVKKDY